MLCPQCGAENGNGSQFCSSCGFGLEATASALPASTAIVYAGLWKRYSAAVIDAVILMGGGAIIGGTIGGIMGFILGALGTDIATIEAIGRVIGFIVGLVLNWLYFTLFESSSKQATLGKMSTGILVTDLDGRRISFGKANARYWGKMVSSMTLFIGFLMAGFTEKKQALHDMIAGTLVVKR